MKACELNSFSLVSLFDSVSLQCSFVVQDGRDDLSEVSAAGYTAVQRQQDSAARSAATKTGGGELTVQFIHPSNWGITPEWLREAPREASSGFGVEYTK